MPGSVDNSLRPPLPWKSGQLALALALVVAAVASMWSAWSDWATESWKQEEHSHVFLVVPFAAAIIYVNRKRLAGLKPNFSWVGPMIVAAGCAIAWIGFNPPAIFRRDSVQSFWHAGAVLIAVGAAITILGHQLIARFWSAFLLLVFMVPMPNTLRLKIAFPLQTTMAIIVERIFTFFGEPVGRQENSITYNGQHILIVEACNGLRGVFTLILVTWLFAFVVPLKTWVRWTLILLSPLVALLCNVIRLIPTLILHGHASKSVAETFHDIAGWLMIVLAFFMLMLVIKLIEAMGFEVRTDRRERGADKGDPDKPAPNAAENTAVVNA